MTRRHRVYLVPGMFGFADLAGYDYFGHVRRALERRFTDAGVQCVTEDVPTPPTSSIRHRALVLSKAARHSPDDEVLHLVGHSTGGLDARLILSPTSFVGVDAEDLAWTRRVSSCVTLNTPHYGTPLAGYFATVSGTRVLYALSLLTVLSLSIGEPGLAVFSKLLAGLGSVDQALGGDLQLVSRASDRLLRFVDDDARGEITRFLGKIRTDQGAIIQIMPEAMDLFNAAAEDDDRVRYACVATASPPPTTLGLARRIRSPYAALTAAMYSTLYRFTSQPHEMYPYARPDAAALSQLEGRVGAKIDDTSNDGIVPTLSMLWGEPIWSGPGDHLDVLGHFHDERKPPEHVDWVTSGAHFDQRLFEQLMDSVATFQLGARP